MSRRQSTVFAIALTLILGTEVMSQQPAGTPQPGPEHKKLAAFVGTWKDEMEMKPGPFGSGGKMSITQTCEWFAGGFSLVCHSETIGPARDLKTLTLLNYNSGEKIYTFYELNSIGVTNLANGTLEGDTWTFNGQSKMGGKLVKTRFTIKMPSPDTALMKSEVSVDGSPWTEIMELKGSRVK